MLTCAVAPVTSFDQRGVRELLEKEFYPEFRASDLVGLPNYHIYLRLMIDGVVSRAFSALTLQYPN